MSKSLKKKSLVLTTLLFIYILMFTLSCSAQQDSLEDQEHEVESIGLEEIPLYEGEDDSLQVEAEDLEYPIATENEGTFKSISPQKAKEMMESGEAIIILDVREQDEFESGHIQDATLIPLSQIPDLAPIEIPDKEMPILVYCRSGRRSLEAAKNLVELGYTRVYEFGGILDWPYEVVR